MSLDAIPEECEKKERPYGYHYDDGIILNVGGKIFKINSNQIKNLPHSRIATLNKYRQLPTATIESLCDDYNENNPNEFYFDRSHQTFIYILAAYRGFKIHIPESACPMLLRQELVYWDIDESHLDICCTERVEEMTTFVEGHETMIEDKMFRHNLKMNRRHLWQNIQSWDSLKNNIGIIRLTIWSTVEDPSSSLLAKVWMVVSIGFILLSFAIYITGTLPDYYTVDDHGIEHEIPVLKTIETVCMSWFTFEFVIRFSLAPKKGVFMLQFLNIVDILTIMPFFLQVFRVDAIGGIETWQKITMMLRVLRVIRIFRLGRHSQGLKLLCVTLQRSSNELFMLAIYLFIGMVILAGLLFAFEDRELFPHLGEAMWFADVTITTVGYGDIVPKTIPGKIVTSFSFLVGLLAIAMPIHPIINNFTKCYQQQKVSERSFKRALQLLKIQEATQQEQLDN